MGRKPLKIVTGRFITFEGGEGSGKSTQVARLSERLRRSGLEVLATREPGGAPGAEDIRRLLVEGRTDRWQPFTEALLHYAARHEHLTRTLRPALNAGCWVVCDRFADSTLAYQGYGHGVDREKIMRLHRLVVEGFAPDLTVILDLPVETGLERARIRGGAEDRYERMDVDFHRRIRAGFLDIATRDLARCAVVDATPDAETVAATVATLVTARLGIGLAR